MTTRFADHFLKGTHAARPAATAVPVGTKYVCSDHSLIYETLDGATWETWASLLGDGSGLSAHISDTTAAHAASAISYAGSTNLSATDVEAALDELDTEKSATGHTHSAPAASAISFSPTGTIAATDVQAAIAEVASEAASTAKTINAQTGTTYTLVLTDAGKFVTMTNASASTLTVPPNSSVAFPAGTVIEGAQLGTGQLTLTPGSGVSIVGSPGLKLAAQYGTFGLIKTGTDAWLAYGRLSA